MALRATARDSGGEGREKDNLIKELTKKIRPRAWTNL